MSILVIELIECGVVWRGVYVRRSTFPPPRVVDRTVLGGIYNQEASVFFRASSVLL